jgi:hypothetical protein
MLFLFGFGYAVILAPLARGQEPWTRYEVPTPLKNSPPPVTTSGPAPPSPEAPVVSEFVPTCSNCLPQAEKTAVDEELPRAWGIIGIRGYVVGEAEAPNGVEFNPFFSLDLDFNFWLWPSHRLYAFFDSRFWAQKPGNNLTNSHQGFIDFSKREWDFMTGGAWNYYGHLEARVYAYSENNLNRGDSLASPFGFNDGIGLENRYYLTAKYDRLGHSDYDVARDSFLSIGYYPTKDMIGLDGQLFKPSAYARAYLTYDLFDEWCYLFLDTTFLTEKPLRAKMWTLNAGVAVRPFGSIPNMEFRLATENGYDIPAHEWDTSVTIGVRWLF